MRLSKYFSKYKLRWQMIATNAFIAIVPLCVLGFIAASQYFNNAKNDIVNSVDMLFTQSTARFDEYFNSIDLVCKSAFYNVSFQNTVMENDELSWANRSEINNYLNSYAQFNDTIRGISFYNYDGYLFNSSIYRLSPEMEHYAEMLRQSPLKNEIYFSDLFVSGGKLMNEFLAVKQINSVITEKSFEPILLGIMVLDRRKLQDIISDSILPEHSELYVIDSSKQVVVSIDKSKINTVISEEFLNAPDSNDFTIVGGESYIVRTSNIRNTDWHLVAMVSTSELMANIKMLQNSLIFLVLALFILMAVANIAFNYVITKPIKNLADAFVSLASGRFDTKIEFPYKNEITVIADNFNVMVDELHILTRKIFDTQSMLYETELENKQIELDGLQEQIGSHFLFNTLTCIRGMALTNEKTQIVEMIDHLVRYFRYSCRKEKKTSIKDEIDHLNIYFAIQKVRFEGDFVFLSKVEDGLGNAPIPMFILQPLVENAIFHGFANRRKHGNIIVTVKRNRENYIIRVFDNGAGISRTRLADINAALKSGYRGVSGGTEGGVALQNVYRRLQLYYGNDCTLEIKSRENVGTIVKLILPVHAR